MSPEERDDLELAGHAIWAFLRDENHGTADSRIRTIKHRFETHTRTKPRHRHPKHVRAITMLAGLGLVVGLAGCVQPPDGVQLDDGIHVTAPEVVHATCRSVDGYTFSFYGTPDLVPPFCIVVGPADPTVPVLQTDSAVSGVPPVTKPAPK